METCVGCGSPLAPAWKFCVHCGIAVEPPEPAVVAGADAAVAPDSGLRNRLLVIGGVGIFLVGIALLVFAITIFAGTGH